MTASLTHSAAFTHTVIILCSVMYHGHVCMTTLNAATSLACHRYAKTVGRGGPHQLAGIH